MNNFYIPNSCHMYARPSKNWFSSKAQPKNSTKKSRVCTVVFRVMPTCSMKIMFTIKMKIMKK